MAAPKCKRCGAPCQKYGGVGGYSVHCEACNEKACIRRNAAYARRHGKTPSNYETVLNDLRSKRDRINAAISAIEEL